MKKLKAHLQQRNTIFILAILGGLLTDYPTRWMQPLILPALGMVMTLSVLNVPNSAFRSPRAMIAPVWMGICMNYLLLGGVIIGLSFLLIHDPALRAGYILIAASPPAIASIPFTSILEGDESFTLFSIVGGYLTALPVLPLIAFLFLDMSGFSPGSLVSAAGSLILLPVIISRLLLWRGWHKTIEPVRGLLTDWSFFIVFYAIIGLNRRIILGSPAMIIPVVSVAFLSIFILGYLIERVGTKLHVKREILTSLVLLGTLKNFGLAGGIALTFFSRESALPSAICSIFLVLSIIWLDYRHKKKADNP
jgi:BASS family bile acid:Na+ symporter